MSTLSDRLRWAAQRLPLKFSVNDELFGDLMEAAAELERDPSERDLMAKRDAKRLVDEFCGGVIAWKDYTFQQIEASSPSKTGWWIKDYDEGGSICSRCGEMFFWEDNAEVYEWNYCPHCGIRMKGKTE